VPPKISSSLFLLSTILLSTTNRNNLLQLPLPERVAPETEAQETIAPVAEIAPVAAIAPIAPVAAIAPLAIGQVLKPILAPVPPKISSSLFLLSTILLSTTNRNNLLQLPLLEALAPEAQALARETQTIIPETRGLAPEAQTIIPETRGLAPETETITPETRGLAPETETITPETRGLAPETETETEALAQETEALAPETITPEIALAAEIQALAPETITPETITPETQALAPETQALAPETITPETQPLAPETQPLAPETQPLAPQTVSAPETTIVSEIARGIEKFIPPFANSTMVGRELSLTPEQRKMVNIIKNNRSLKKVNTLLLTLPIDIQLEFIDILLPIFNKLKFDEKTYFDTSKPLLKLITEIKVSAERKQKLLTLPGPVLQPILTPESSRIPTSLFLLSTILLSITNSKSLIAESVEMPVAKYIRTVISPLAPGSLAPGSLAPGSLAPGSLTPGSLAPGSLTPGSLAPGSLAPGSLAPGSETIATAQDIEDNAGSGLRPIIPELSQELINILNSFMKLDPNTVLKDKLQKIDKIIDDNISNIGNLNAELKQFNIIITSNNICINIEK
jgi:hypothetical protein